MPKQEFLNGKLTLRYDPADPNDKAKRIREDIAKGRDLSKYTKADLVESIKQIH